MELSVAESVPFRGRLKLSVVDAMWLREARSNTAAVLNPPPGVVHDVRAGDNVVCTTGFTVLSSALVWSGLQDQSTNLAITSPTYLTPLYGAVGSGVGTVAKSDTALFTELSRVTVGGGAASPATSSIAAECTWLFYFPQPGAAWVVTEAGVFANATSASGSGSMMDHWAFSPSVSVPTIDSLILQVSFGFGP